jgi:hypothetical protein
MHITVVLDQLDFLLVAYNRSTLYIPLIKTHDNGIKISSSLAARSHAASAIHPIAIPPISLVLVFLDLAQAGHLEAG